MADQVSNKTIDDAAKAFAVQRAQDDRMQDTVKEMQKENIRLQEKTSELVSEVDRVVQEMLCSYPDLLDEEVSDIDTEEGKKLIELSDEENENIVIPVFDIPDKIDVGNNWKEYSENYQKYAKEHHIDLSKDPFDELLSESDKQRIGKTIREDYAMKEAHCDKADYAIAAICGVICGLIDVLLVGSPTTDFEDSQRTALNDITDKTADNLVKKVANFFYSFDKTNNGNKTLDTIPACIRYLEEKFVVPYDASYAKNLSRSTDTLNEMNPASHHEMSLDHYPDIIGLLFSIIDQFNDKGTYANDGKMIRTGNKKSRFELHGKTVPQKLAFGCINWLGHCISDLAGSSGTREKIDSRGMGLPVPLTDLLEMCKFSDVDLNHDGETLGSIATKVYAKGYDTRFAACAAIPVVLNDFLIRFLYMLKQHFYHKKTWSDSFPFGKEIPEIRRMMTVGYGTLCSIDAAGAAIETAADISTGFGPEQLISYFMNLNQPSWTKLAMQGLAEARTLYCKNAIDTEALDETLETEWEKLL